MNYDPDKVKWTVEEYLAGIRYVESGSVEGDYTAVNDRSGAYGAYQLLPKYRDWMIEQAGENPGEIDDPEVQDRVAEYWARHHYERLGNWELVAVAWHKGGSNAQKVIDESGHVGPAVTIEMIEAVFPGESRYVEKMNYGAAYWRMLEMERWRCHGTEDV